MFIHKDIVYRNNVRKTTLISVGIIAGSELFWWVSLGGWYVGGTNEKVPTCALCALCALCGKSLRAAAGSFDDMAD